jgi:hypothetical protein
MSIDDDIRDQEERFHVAPATLAYLQGYRDGRASVTSEVAKAIEALDALAVLHGDGILSKSARDRLRALL